MTIEVDCFSTLTPWRFTSSGSRGSAMATRFWVRTAAMSGSVPILKVTVKSILPVLELFEDM